MKSIETLAPAKLNLFLEVLDKREDDFHNISSVMQSVNLYDKVRIDINDTGVINTVCSAKHIPDGEKNIAHKAAVKFFEYTGLKNPGINIKIEKKIPSSAGLAGGSTDAASTLKILNKLFEAKLNIDELRQIAVKIGADVPFCLTGGTLYCEGIGDIITPLPELCECKILLAFSSTRVSTPDAYQKIDDLGIRNYMFNNFKQILKTGIIKNIADNLYNVFEKIVPDCKYPKGLILNNGGLGALMSGSGPSVFGLFEVGADLRPAISALRTSGYAFAVCEPLKGNEGLIPINSI